MARGRKEAVCEAARIPSSSSYLAVCWGYAGPATETVRCRSVRREEILGLGSSRLRARTNGCRGTGGGGSPGDGGGPVSRMWKHPLSGFHSAQSSVRPDFVSGVSSSTRGLKLKFWRGNEVPPLEVCAGRIFYCCFWSGFFPCLASRHGRTPIWLTAVSYLISPEGS